MLNAKKISRDSPNEITLWAHLNRRVRIYTTTWCREAIRFRGFALLTCWQLNSEKMLIILAVAADFWCSKQALEKDRFDRFFFATFLASWSLKFCQNDARMMHGQLYRAELMRFYRQVSGQQQPHFSGMVQRPAACYTLPEAHQSHQPQSTGTDCGTSLTLQMFATCQLKFGQFWPFA